MVERAKDSPLPAIREIDPDQWYPARLVCRLIPTDKGIGMHLTTFHRWRLSGRINAVNRGTKRKPSWFVQGRELQRVLDYREEHPPLPETKAQRNRRITEAGRAFAKLMGGPVNIGGEIYGAEAGDGR